MCMHAQSGLSVHLCVCIVLFVCMHLCVCECCMSVGMCAIHVDVNMYACKVP